MVKMSATKDIAGLSNTMMAAALVGKNYDLVKKKKKTTKDFLSTGVTNIAGTTLLKANADFLSGID